MCFAAVGQQRPLIETIVSFWSCLASHEVCLCREMVQIDGLAADSGRLRPEIRRYWDEPSLAKRKNWRLRDRPIITQLMFPLDFGSAGRSGVYVNCLVI